MAASKLSARLREHDWLGAVIELAIVVVGILIALQVSNWNQDRVDSMRADRYYARLHADLINDVANIDNADAFWQQVMRFGERAMAHSERGELVEGSAWKTLLAYYQAGQLYPFELVDTTFTEMRASGDLALIADEDLRKRLAEYYALTGDGIRGQILRHDPAYRMRIRGLTPWNVQQYIWTHCFRQGEGARQILIDCKSPVSDEQAATILDSYRHDPALLQDLRTWMSLMQVSRIIVAQASHDAHALADSVEAARNK